MWNSKHSTTLSIVVCWIVVALVTAFAVAGHWFNQLWFIGY